MEFDAKTVRAWLEGVTEKHREVDTLQARYDALVMRIESVRVSKLDGMPHAKGFDGDAFGEALARVERVEDELKAKIDESRLLYDEIDRAIDLIKCTGWADCQTVLRARYLDCFKWDAVSEILYGRNLDFDEREDTYLRRTHKVHGKALNELASVLNEKEEI